MNVYREPTVSEYKHFIYITEGSKTAFEKEQNYYIIARWGRNNHIWFCIRFYEQMFLFHAVKTITFHFLFECNKL